MEVLPKNSFQTRMQWLIKKAGSQDKLGDLCGLSGVIIGKYLAGTEPSREKLVALAKAGGVSIGWLANGEGEMVPGAPVTVAEVQSLYATTEDLKHEYVMVPRYNVKVSAGGGSLVESEQVVDLLAFKTTWIHNIMHLNPANLLLVNTVGDSMYATIKEGDLLLVDKGQREVREDAIYILQNDGVLVAKRLQKLYDGSIQIKSDNPVYAAQLVPFDRVNVLNIIGRVVWKGGRV